MPRTTKYDPSFCDRAREFASAGMVDTEIAQALSIGRSTLDKYKLEYPEFKAAITEGKQRPNQLVASAVFRNAFGFEYEEQEYARNEKGRLVLVKKTVKFNPGNPTDRKFFLINRDPTHWRDKQDHEHNVAVTISHEQALKELE